VVTEAKGEIEIDTITLVTTYKNLIRDQTEAGEVVLQERANIIRSTVDRKVGTGR